MHEKLDYAKQRSHASNPVLNNAVFILSWAVLIVLLLSNTSLFYSVPGGRYWPKNVMLAKFVEWGGLTAFLMTPLLGALAGLTRKNYIILIGVLNAILATCWALRMVYLMSLL